MSHADRLQEIILNSDLTEFTEYARMVCEELDELTTLKEGDIVIYNFNTKPVACKIEKIVGISVQIYRYDTRETTFVPLHSIKKG